MSYGRLLNCHACSAIICHAFALVYTVGYTLARPWNTCILCTPLCNCTEWACYQPRSQGLCPGNEVGPGKPGKDTGNEVGSLHAFDTSGMFIHFGTHVPSCCFQENCWGDGKACSDSSLVVQIPTWNIDRWTCCRRASFCMKWKKLKRFF